MKTTNDRDEAIKTIRTELKRRSGKSWSVTGGRGTAWGWIKIDAPPTRCTWFWKQKPGTNGNPEDFEEVDGATIGGHMSPTDRAELGALLGLKSVHYQGVSISAGSDHRREYIERAEGRPVTQIAQPYWD